VGGSFYCYNNNLTSLQGGPQAVGGDFYCYNNNLTSLQGAPQVVGGRFDCSSNKLTSLEGAPQAVGGSFYCHYNQLTSQEGGPEQYAPQKVREIILTKGYLLADGILAKVINKKGNVYKVEIVGKTEPSYVLQDGENFAHGVTIQKAVEDLRFKTASKDTSQFKSWDINEAREVSDLVFAYRCITGACGQGVELFCKTIDTTKKYTIKKVIEMTQDKYGHEQFKTFFNGEV
jgi:hypothetical protein